MTWHADPALLARYARGDIDEARASSVEAHLIACDVCRSALTPSADLSRHEAVWGGIRREIHAPRPKIVEQILRWLGTPDHYARLLAATPSLSASWLLAVVVALGFALIASHEGKGNPLPFLIIAPLLPLAGVAAAYGPGLDPTYEIGVSSPMRGGRILFVRAAAVFSVTSVLGGIASLALPELDWTAAAWLLPALGMAVASLTLSTWISPALASGGVAAAWVGLVIATVARTGVTQPDRLPWFKPVAQVAFCFVAVVAACVAIIRSDQIDAARHH